MGYTQFKKSFGNQIALFILAVVGISVASYSPIFSSTDHHLISGFVSIDQPDRITCGPTCALMLLRYYGNDEVDVDELTISSKTHWFDYNKLPIGMTSPYDLLTALNTSGLPCEMSYGSMSTLREHIGEDRPVIVLLRSDEYLWHYVVATGYNKDHIIVATDGYYKHMKNEHFRGSWEFSADMDGNRCSDKIFPGLLGLADVYPFMMIVPKESRK